MKYGLAIGIGSLLASLFASTVPAVVAEESLPAVQSIPDEYCCVITGVDRHRAVVRAVDEDLGRVLQFVVRDRLLLGTLRPGQAVSADYTRMEVIAGSACENMPCPIVAVFNSTRPSAIAFASALEQEPEPPE